MSESTQPGLRSRILVVDDEPGLLRAVERVLRHEHSLVTCGSAALAIDLLQQQPFDLVLSDISMPGMDGFALMQQLREVRSGVEVILMTGQADQDATLVRAIRDGAFYFLQKPFNRDVLRALVARCAEIRWLRESRRQNSARIQRELTEGRRLQQGVLRPGRLNVPGLSLCARLEPSSELSGDLFDYAELPDGRLAFLVADITGHGVSAAMLTAGVIAAFRLAASEQFQPQAVLRAIYSQLQVFPTERFVTFFAGRIDVATGELEFLNAGHPSAMLLNPDVGVEELESSGPMVSPTFGPDEWEVGRAVVEHGGWLHIYTDGLIEAGGVGRMYGQPRLRDQVTRIVSEQTDTGAAIDILFDDLRAHAPGVFQDDLTAMLIRRD